MTMAKAESYASVAARAQHVPRGLANSHAIELVKDRGTKEPDADFAQHVIDEARDRGLLLLKCGPHKNVVRLLPPLTASSDEIASALARLESAVMA